MSDAASSREEVRRLARDVRARLAADLARRGARAYLRPPRSAPARPTPRLLTLEAVRAELGECTRCRLHAGRTQIVFGVGHPHARVVIIGEAPGHDEDQQGEPFVGRAGQMLTKGLEAIGLPRDQVYITNVIKCRPPGNRSPLPDEIAQCEPFLRLQLAAIRPALIVALGNYAAQWLLATREGITRLRGHLHTYQGIPVLPAYHPAAALRNPKLKRPFWEDLKLLRREYDRLMREAG